MWLDQHEQDHHTLQQPEDNLAAQASVKAGTWVTWSASTFGNTFGSRCPVLIILKQYGRHAHVNLPHMTCRRGCRRIQHRVNRGGEAIVHAEM